MIVENAGMLTIKLYLIKYTKKGLLWNYPTKIKKLLKKCLMSI